MRPVTALAFALVLMGSTPPLGSTIAIIGDSITGGGGVTPTPSCTISPPTSACFADVLTSYYSGVEYNDGEGGTCMQKTTTASSNCNASSALILRYTSTIISYNSTHTVNHWYILMGATDIDFQSAVMSPGACGTVGSDSALSAATYQANMTTILNAMIAAAIPTPNITVISPIWNPCAVDTITQSYDVGANTAAVAAGVIYADAYTPMKACGLSCFASSTTPHPNNTGHAIIATAAEGAGFLGCCRL